MSRVEGWLRFFLLGVAEVSLNAARTAQEVLGLREEARDSLQGQAAPLALLDNLFQEPIVSVRRAQSVLGSSFATAAKAVAVLEAKDLLQETTGGRRNRKYRFGPYLELFRLVT